MIISASRRTDIPKFYSTWFMNRIREGYCTYPNPFNRHQINKISLLRQDVDAIVFWSKDPFPLLQYLNELDSNGYKYYFQFTINGYMGRFEPEIPPMEELVQTFSKLVKQIGLDKVIWRYDPIILSNITNYEYHFDQFNRIANRLAGLTKKVIISLVDDYRGAGQRMSKLTKDGIEVVTWNLSEVGLGDLLRNMVGIAHDAGMKIESCAEGPSLQSFGIEPGRCVDNELIYRLFGVTATDKKDPSQRPACGCVISRDIGIYGTCQHNCIYCYAMGNSVSKEKHDPNSPSLVGWYEPEPGKEAEDLPECRQGRLF